MKLIRFGELGAEKPGILTAQGDRKDCSSQFDDWDHTFFQTDGLKKLSSIAARADTLPDVPKAARWGSPVARPYKLIGIGLNYSDHAAESGMAIPSEPIVFQKATNSACGPYDPIVIPPGSLKTDWEVELGIIVNCNAKYLASPDEAAKCIAGYCISHDVSERHWQLERGGQWNKGKSFEGFNPLGPWLVTTDEVADPRKLNLRLDVNGVRRQTGNTDKMIFDVFYLVYYLSQFMTLEAGDVITTGTPPGVGLGQKPPVFLKTGDVVTLGIDGLGEQRSECI
jgi:2,4-didehydro-3-deoxy-L-rhamnonate hydrolase